MTKLYQKNELYFSLLWIMLYVILASFGDNLSASCGISKIITAPLCIILSGILWFWINKNNLKEKYGLCAFKGNAASYLWFVPLIFIASTNLWGGFTLRLSVFETALYVVSMIGVGFIEEVLFRGFLFLAICQENNNTTLRQPQNIRAVAISSLTFGIGHIVNLCNGADLAPTLLQICYASAIGFLFTIIFYKGKSLLPCILTHCAINSLSAFAVEGSERMNMITAILLTVVSAGYGIWILKSDKK